jgi:outer membrane protein assembly factor BamB
MRPLHAIPLLALLGTIDLTAARPAHAAGWRNSGTGVVEGAAPPIPGADETAVRWKTRTQAWSNASPVAFGDMVCITEEPATLACFDADSGARRWDAESLYPHTLQGEERQRKEALLADLDQQAARLGELRIELTRMQRQLRQSPSSGLTQQDLDRHLQQMNDIEARLAEHEDLRMAKDMGVIGYATPTPAVSGDGIFAVFGNGVLSRFDPTGQRVWSIWLGEPHPFMEGFDFGTTASPVVSDGVLLVAAKHLFGIDPRSGEVLWRGPEYPHYGAPTVAHVGERAVVATPAGELLDLETGAASSGRWPWTT